MAMIHRSVVARFILVTLLAALAVSAQTKKKTSAKAEPALPPGAVELHGVVISDCGARGKEELRELTATTAKNGVLSLTLEVSGATITVPVFNTITKDCEDKSFYGRMYRDSVSGKLTFPGPTLRVRRASKGRPGDSIRVLLKNDLPPSADSETCVWAGAPELCDCTTGLLNPPQCCNQKIKPTGMNCFHGSNTTNLHFHGAHVSPQEPQDWVFLELSPEGQKFAHDPPRADQRTGQFQYAIDPLSERQPEGTHWYHPHKHGSTAEQVGNGMAGALIVEGPFDDWLQEQYKAKGPLVEKVMILQQVHDLNYTSVTRVGRQFDKTEIENEPPPGTPMPLINGQLVPKITMNPGEIQRWRLISATMEASAQLVIDLDGRGPKQDTIQVRQIAMDGVQFSPKNYQAQPLLNTACRKEKDGKVKCDPKFQLSPGNRGDFLVKAPDQRGTWGTTVLIPYEVIGAVGEQGTGMGRGNKPVQRALTRAALDALAPGDRQPALLSVYICNPATDQGCVKKSMEFPEPKDFVALPDFLSRPMIPTRFHNVQFQVLGPEGDEPPPGELPVAEGRFGVQMHVRENDKDQLKFRQFDPRCANFTAPLDSVEEWHISQNINTKEGAPPFHVFHIHTNPFQVVGTERYDEKKKSYVLTAYPEPIWQDSITLPDNDDDNPGNADTADVRVVIRRRVEDFTGAYVLHCHFLGHEDRGMMLMVQAVCPGTNSFSRTGSGRECINKDSLVDALPPCPGPPGTAGHGGH
jgi:FtsP/CotA-like multicopper oxidase with cupredoxin domain